MALDFDGDSSQYLWASSASATSLPITMCCWVSITVENSAQMTLISAGSSSTSTQYYELKLINSVDRVMATHSSGSGSSAFIDGYTRTGWHFVMAEFLASNSRKAWLDSSSGTSSASVGGVTASRTSVGARRTTTATNYLYGTMADAAIYQGRALTSSERTALSLGYSPLLVARDALANYWEITGFYSPEVDLVGTENLTYVGSPTIVEHIALARPHMPRRIEKADDLVGLTSPLPPYRPFRG